MTEVHALSIKIEPGRVDTHRFWWSICEGARVIERSSYSHATRREAEKEATGALRRIKARHGVK
jgi:hypothetical protein